VTTEDAADIAALHQAARRYCVDRHARWADEYAAMQAARPFTFAKAYGDDDYRVFPRYLVLEAIRSAIERWQPADVATVAAARARLGEDATAESRFTAIAHPLARAAMAEERAAFVAFAGASTPADWASAAPLPYRRVLAPPEAHALARAFVVRWGDWYGGWPSRTDVPPHLTLHDEAREALPLRAAIDGFLAACAITRVFELREDGDSYQLDVGATTFEYDFREGRWFTDGCPWMIYASHESSITFGGGELIAHLRAALPGVDAFEYRGWSDPPSKRR
jgi:hypothetical protein